LPYQDTDNKRCIRQAWDKPILANWQRRVGHRLSYFGLTGPKIHDLLDWRDQLAAERTTVESLGKTPDERINALEIKGEIFVNAGLEGVGSRLQVLLADVEDVIIDGIDSEGEYPQVNDLAKHVKTKKPKDARNCLFGYDLVNLDFDGGLGNIFKRTRALKKLLERQSDVHSILLITFNVRSKMAAAISREFAGLRKEYSDADWYSLVDWHARQSRGSEPYRLKALVPNLVGSYAGYHNLKSYAYAPIYYEGWNAAHLVHFAFELYREEGVFRSRPVQSTRELLSLPLLEAYGGHLRIAPVQHPGFSAASCEKALGVLAAGDRAQIISQYVPN
jgi:hypothetical protein